MARKGLIQNNLLRQQLCTRFAERRKELAVAIKKEGDLEKKLELIAKLGKLPRNSSATRYRNRCSITGRARGYNKYTGMCRIIARESIHLCLLPGFVKGRARG